MVLNPGSGWEILNRGTLRDFLVVSSPSLRDLLRIATIRPQYSGAFGYRCATFGLLKDNK
jgi:hypothetical protein